ncbi:response regulator [bacterium]|nr:response regulator [bacterium]
MSESPNFSPPSAAQEDDRGRPPFRILLVDDDEDDYIIVRDLLAEIRGWKFELKWVATYEIALEAIQRRPCDVCLIDYRLGARSGLEFLRQASGINRRVPMILLTGQGGHEIDVEAMRAGAADFLVKGRIDAALLERSIRYAVERTRTLEALQKAQEELERRVAELSRANETLAEKERLLNSFHRAAQTILSPLDPAQILDNLAKQIVEAGIFRSLMVALVDEGAKRVEISRGLWRDPDGHILWNPQQMVGASYALEDDNITAQVARTGEMQVVEEWDERFDRRFSQPEDRRGKVSYFIPVKQGGRVLAVLATGSQVEEKEETLRRIEVMRPLLDQIAIALEHARLYREVQEYGQQLIAINRSLAEINRNLEAEIAERKQAEEALRRAHDDLKETNAELESFTYSVSHDLRAPLRAMQGFADALQEDYADRLDPTGQDYAWRIVAAARRMDTLIQDLLTYSRLSRADLRLHPISLRGMAKDVLAQMDEEFRERNAQVTVQGPLPEVVGHRATLVQVVMNLLANAVKFVNPDTPPCVRIWAEDRDGWVRLCVEDNGIGIAPEHHERIFRVFERLHGVETYPGTGIGLAIVRKGMERMGGRVGVESEVGRGSRFWIELPKAEDEP